MAAGEDTVHKWDTVRATEPGLQAPWQIGSWDQTVFLREKKALDTGTCLARTIITIMGMAMRMDMDMDMGTGTTITPLPASGAPSPSVSRSTAPSS